MRARAPVCALHGCMWALVACDGADPTLSDSALAEPVDAQVTDASTAPSDVDTGDAYRAPMVPRVELDGGVCFADADGGFLPGLCALCDDVIAKVIGVRSTSDAGCDGPIRECRLEQSVCYAPDSCQCDGQSWVCGIQSCP